jgi:hypothetical protein
LYTLSSWVVLALTFGPLEDAISNSLTKGLFGAERSEIDFEAHPTAIDATNAVITTASRMGRWQDRGTILG